jgi:hypothetical protein
LFLSNRSLASLARCCTAAPARGYSSGVDEVELLERISNQRSDSSPLNDRLILVPTGLRISRDVDPRLPSGSTRRPLDAAARHDRGLPRSERRPGIGLRHPMDAAWADPRRDSIRAADL